MATTQHKVVWEVDTMLDLFPTQESQVNISSDINKEQFKVEIYTSFSDSTDSDAYTPKSLSGKVLTMNHPHSLVLSLQLINMTIANVIAHSCQWIQWMTILICQKFSLMEL